MWGTIETLTSPVVTAIAAFQTQQLSRVNYKRPETWHWLFFARLVSGPVPVGDGNTVTCGIAFNLTVGLGRASVTLPEFEVFRFNYGSSGPPPEPKWSTTGIRPERTPGDDPDYTIFQMVAQDIQCAALVTTSGDGIPPNVPIIVELGAFFAPKNHIRPEWLQLDVPLETQFPGAELEGR
jgi:hypothetical protein